MKQEEEKNFGILFCVLHFKYPVTICGYSHILDWNIIIVIAWSVLHLAVNTHKSVQTKFGNMSAEVHYPLRRAFYHNPSAYECN